MKVPPVIKIGAAAALTVLAVGLCIRPARETPPWRRSKKPRSIPGRLRWVRQWGGDDRVVRIDARRLNTAWQNHTESYFGPNGSGGIEGRYEKFGSRLADTDCPVWMPHIGLDQERDAIVFTDGRHRFAWLRDHGVKSLPITTAPEEVEEIKRRFGTQSRVSWLPAQRP